MTSIIIPAHNEKENLKELLPQLAEFRKDFPVEIILALSSDNSDGSETLASVYPIKCIQCKKKGRAVQMNSAANLVKEGILVFLHADVTPPDTFISDISTAIKEGFDAGFFSYHFDKKSVALQVNSFFTAKDGIFTGGGDQCLFIKKKVFDTLGGFDEKQVLMEDFEFFRRMKKSNVRYTIVKEDLIVSARKYRNNSYIKINLANFLLVILFKCGYPAKKLNSLHDRLNNMPYQNNA
ncbi:TIGR04283 family arsenosugar biosynthesis glycosyltransferase [Pricia sp.]|uniref:TIGR04283 family arsenosugar biosynthesis glycosyltransferase n=1 Tax=Pricia sp. TaxID=2268138 RepID=UPI003592EACE